VFLIGCGQRSQIWRKQRTLRAICLMRVLFFVINYATDFEAEGVGIEYMPTLM
jgi:hypothetical protein